MSADAAMDADALLGDEATEQPRPPDDPRQCPEIRVDFDVQRSDDDDDDEDDSQTKLTEESPWMNRVSRPSSHRPPLFGGVGVEALPGAVSRQASPGGLRQASPGLVRQKNRPVIRYLPSAGGVKKLGLSSVASESVFTTSASLGGSHGVISPTCNGHLAPHRPGALHQVSSDVVMAKNLGFDFRSKPLALHEVASETAMALSTGRCNLHKNCSLQGASWQNLCHAEADKRFSVELALALPNGLTPSVSLQNASRNSSSSQVFPEEKNSVNFNALSGSTISVSPFPFCRICHMAANDCDEPLISPCRCSGTMKYIHGSCLMKWMDICSRKSRKSQRCELCQYQYTRRKRFQVVKATRYKEWKWPRCNKRDKVLHFVFFLNLIIMAGCAVATVYCFLSDKGLPKRARYLRGDAVNHDASAPRATVVETSAAEGRPDPETGADPYLRGQVDLTSEEVVTLCCGVLFFISFFVAMYAQIKAKHTLYQLFVRFSVLNTTWEIEEYDRAKDPLYNRPGKPANQLPTLL